MITRRAAAVAHRAGLDAPVEQAHCRGVRLRPATSSDVANIARLLHANRDDVSLFQQSPADILRNLDGFVVADRDGSVVGCACIHRYHADLVEIFSVAVDPAHQGQGLGTSLMNALLQAEKRARTVWLYAPPFTWSLNRRSPYAT